MTYDVEAGLREHGRDFVALGKAWGVSRHEARNIVRRATRKPHVPASEQSVASPLTQQPITLEQLFDLFRLQRNEWNVIEITPNVWQMGSAHPETGEILAAPLYQLKVRLRPVAPPALMVLGHQILEDIKQDAQVRPRYHLKGVARPATGDDGYMAEIETPDLHVGKMAWGEETGTDYDSGIAESLAREHVTELLWHCDAYPIEQFVLPVGNDLLHFELSGNTTAGTPQDADTRWLKMFRRARGIISWTIKTLAARAPVVVIIVPGNHARMGEMALGEVLAAEFAGDPRVTFDASPAPRKYHRYGRNLLGLAHGDGEPHAKYPQLMAVEQPQMWAETTHREFHIGHLHTARRTEPMTIDDKLGVTVRIMRSLSGVDAWHKSKGYLGTRGAEAFIWRKSGGIVANFLTYVRQAA